MTDQEKYDFSKYLDAFDEAKLDAFQQRRMAYKPLYDFFQRLILDVGINLLNLPENSLKPRHLIARWRICRGSLSQIDKPEKWDKLIVNIDDIRHKVEHHDENEPNVSDLKEIRKKAPEFKEWLIQVGIEFHKKSSKFTFRQTFNVLASQYIDEAEIIFEEFGVKPPYAAEFDSSFLIEDDSYQKLPEIINSLKNRVKKISDFEEVTREDLDRSSENPIGFSP